MIGTGSSPCEVSYARISSVASIPPMKGMETSIYYTAVIRALGKTTMHTTYQDYVERLVPLDTRPERIDGQLSILSDLDTVAILLENLHCQLLVDEVILGDKDVVRHILRCYDRRDRI